MKKKIIIWGIVLLIVIEGVLGLGLRPAKTTISFEPDLERTYQFKIVNNDHKDLDVDVEVEGELADYLELPTKTAHLDKDQELLYFDFKIKLPKELSPGGVEGRIIITEKLEEVEVSGNVFNARLKVAHKVIVNVPYPEKYLDAEIEYEEKPESIDLKLSAKNLGREDIGALKTTFEVYDDDKKLISAETSEESLEANENKVLSASIDKSKVKYGEFNILASIFYDNYWLELEKKLVMGRPEIEILYFDKYFIFGKINKFTVDLLNKWNKELRNVFVDVFVFKDGKQVESIRTASFEMEGYESKKVEGYFDANKELGDYDFEVVVNYGEEKTHKKFKGSILEEEKGEKIQEEKSSKGFVYVLIGVLFGLVIIILVFYFGTGGKTEN